jgi:predicted hydrocarbon binding protein
MDRNNFETLKLVFENYFKIDISEDTRDYKYVYARMIMFKILREDFGMKFQRIGEIYGKHHATVLHMVRKFHEIASYDKKITRDYEKLLFNYEVSVKTEHTVKDLYRILCLVEDLKTENEKLKRITDNRMFKLINTIHPDAEPNIYYKLEAIVKMNNIVNN